MTAGYLHAVGVTFLSLQFVCVLYNPRSCLMSISLRATAQNVIQIRMEKKIRCTNQNDYLLTVYLPSILTVSRVHNIAIIIIIIPLIM